MPSTTANEIQIEYDTFGEKTAPPIVLIMGLGMQMIHWEDEFCQSIADKGFHVIRFDNRDAGLSQKFDDKGVPDVMKAFSAVMAREKVESAYTLNDMADDVVGLLDALDIPKAHICGVSMGGMITQLMGVRHPSRVLSLTSIMSTTGNPKLPQAKPEAMEVLLTPPPSERDAYIDFIIKTRRAIGSPKLPFDEEHVRIMAGKAFDRAFYPQGIARQYVAILENGNRTKNLASITAPTLIIHGADDPLIPFEAGIDTANAIPGAAQLIIDGMGHDLPRQVWQQVAEAITAHAKGEGNKKHLF